MGGLNIQGAWVEDPMLVKNEIKNFFKNKFREEENDQSISFEGIQFNTLNALQASKLVEKFTAE